VLRECGRRDQDRQEQQQRLEAELLDYIRAERAKDTPYSEIGKQILQHKVPFSPDAERYVDQLIQTVKAEEQKKQDEFKREQGFKTVMRKPKERGGIEH
jgi:hypothetical protein